jgi:serine/threonine protein kinase
MILRGNISNDIFEKYLNRHEQGEGSNLFEFFNKKNIVVGKLFKFGLSKNALKIYLELKNENFVEVFLDYSILNLNNEKYYFGFFNKISFSSKNIPGLFRENDALKLIFDSLNYIHSKGILHHDINPSNIMCTLTSIVLIDFEFAINIENTKIECNSILNYTHPKVILKKDYLWKNVDYWAAICSIYEIFKTKPLFDDCCDSCYLISVFDILDNELDILEDSNYLNKLKNFY